MTALFVVASGANVVPASASASPPSPTTARSQLDLGIHSDRQALFNALPNLTNRRGHARQPLTSACAAAWRVVGNQNGTWNNFLVGVASISPTDVWAVGNSQDGTTGYDHNLAEHWDGTAWSIVPTPDPGLQGNDLNDVAAISSTDVWAVGITIDSGGIPTHGTALHWNGTAWTDMSPAFSAPFVLNSVTTFATNDVWAVGDIVLDNGSGTLEQRTLIVRWNGSSWTQNTSPNVGSGINVLNSVRGSGASDVWAVGRTNAGNFGESPRSTLIEHWDGLGWTVKSSPTIGNDTLMGVAAGSAASAWAVGYYRNGPSLVTVNLVWDGASWASAPIAQPNVNYSILSGVVAAGANEYWSAGSYYDSATASITPFTEHWNGSTWTFGQGAAAGSIDDEFFNVAVSATGDLWAVGSYLSPARLARNLVESFSGLAAPSTVAATTGDATASVTWAAPCSDGGSAITSYVVTAHDGCTIRGSMTVAASAASANFTGLSNGTSLDFTVTPVNGFGLGPESAPSSVVTPSGATAPAFVTACSAKQYSLAGSDGVTWHDMDSATLAVSFTPAANSWAVISGNADLWTDRGGFNQDIAIAVNGSVAAWKESGGFAGTFSPNAANVQAAIPVLASTTYTAKLQWKANKSDAHSIFAGAGPIGSDFSPTRLTVELIPASSNRVFTGSSPLQYSLHGSDGSTWVPMDSGRLAVNFSVPASGWDILLSANVDLFTAQSGYNQDVGVALSGSGSPYAGGDPELWKESGGFAGTFSPNAAFMENVRPFAPAPPFTATLVWKANRADPGTIFAGAGPIGGQFSPTSVTVILEPIGPPSYPTSRLQYEQVNSDGAYWQAIDLTYLAYTYVSTPADYAVSANADLWTSVAGYNEDIGIMVSGGVYGPGTLVAWKESGGFAGTFSPNAAFVTTLLHFDPGSSYVIWPVWKANRLAQEYNSIWVGAGPIGSGYSTTAMAVVRVA